MNEIQKNMKKYNKTEGLAVSHSGWEIAEKGGNYQSVATPTLQVKATTLAETGVLHLQFSCADVAGLHDDIKEILGTPIVDGQAIMREYGVAFNIRVPHTSLDEMLLKQLGDKTVNNKECPKVKSFASLSVDYVKMVYKGVVEAYDNAQEQNIVQALDFRIGHENHMMCIGFSNMQAINGEWNDMPHLNPIWFVAWLASLYLVTEEEEE